MSRDGYEDVIAPCSVGVSEALRLAASKMGLCYHAMLMSDAENDVVVAVLVSSEEEVFLFGKLGFFC